MGSGDLYNMYSVDFGSRGYIMKFFTMLGEVLGDISCVYDLWAHTREGVGRHQ